MVACSTMSNAPSASGMAKLTVSISDPATCQAPNGPFSAVYVTITDVQANLSSTAGDSDSGWVDLTPNLKPTQVNLLGLPGPNGCFLATLGDALELQAGSYQQIRIMLASNSAASVSGNKCSSGNNCVVLSADSSVHTLDLSSEAQTGIKIPPGQIAGGAITVAQGKTEDLDIDFNTCASIVHEGNGQYRLKPTLHAGVVSTTSSSINGTVLDAATGNPSTGMVEVALEQRNAGAPDTIVMSTLTDANGNFVFCPVSAGTYDVVVVGADASSNFYQPAILTGVSTGSTTGTIKLNMPASNGNAALTALITSSDTSTPTKAIAIDADLSVLEAVGGTTYTIPLPPFAAQSSGTLTVETAASTTTLTCPMNTDCVEPTLNLPAGGVYLYAYATSGPALTTTGSGVYATYVLDAQAFEVGTNTRDCSVATPADLQTAPLALTAATTYPASITGVAPATTLAFTSCQ